MAKKQRSLIREVISDFFQVVKVLFWVIISLFTFLIIFSMLPSSFQGVITDKVLALFGQYEVTTTEIYSEVEEFEEEPKFVIGFQMITDSIVTKTKKPFCDPAYYKTIFSRKANYIYDIKAGEVEIQFALDTVYFRDESVHTSNYCNVVAQPLSVETLERLQDSILVSYPLEINKTEDEVKEIVASYIRKEHINWKESIRP